MPAIRMAVTAFLSLALLAGPAAAQKKYDPGAIDTEIKLGQTMPYSGPLSGFITLAKAEIAYFQMINDTGGVNGRKITMISLDDGFSPPKTVEQTRRLVEQDQVLAISGSLGTATNASVQKYLNTQEGAAALPGDRRQPLERSRKLPLHHDADADLSGGGPHLRRLHAEGGEGSQGRGALPERRFRQGFPEGLPRSAWAPRRRRSSCAR